MISKLNKINFLLKKPCLSTVYFLHKILLLRSDFVIYQTVAMLFKGHLTKNPHKIWPNKPKEWTTPTGDIINIHDIQEDGWWLGEL